MVRKMVHESSDKGPSCPTPMYIEDRDQYYQDFKDFFVTPTLLTAVYVFGILRKSFKNIKELCFALDKEDK